MVSKGAKIAGIAGLSVFIIVMILIALAFARDPILFIIAVIPIIAAAVGIYKIAKKPGDQSCPRPSGLMEGQVQGFRQDPDPVSNKNVYWFDLRRTKDTAVLIKMVGRGLSGTLESGYWIVGVDTNDWNKTDCCYDAEWVDVKLADNQIRRVSVRK
jgi:hypothetical protein